MCWKIYFYLTFVLFLVQAEEDSKTSISHVIKNQLNISDNFPKFEYKSYNENFADSSLGLLYRGLQNLNQIGSYLSIFDWTPLSWGKSKIANKNNENRYSEGGSSNDDVRVIDTTTSLSRGRDINYSSLSSKRKNNFIKVLNYPSNVQTIVSLHKQKGNKLPKKYDNYYNNYYYECGQVQIKRIKRIIGGHNSKIGKHPWQASLYKPTLKAKPYCGGALLNERWIITAAHCLANKSIADIKIRLGEYDVKNRDENLFYEEYKIITAEVHPKFSIETHRNDVALLKLDKIVYFDWHIIPICLPPKNIQLVGRKATVSGWGRRIDKERKSSPAILNEVDVEVFPNQICEKWFSDAGHKENIDDMFLCAGYKKGGRDACHGDSGGPLTTKMGEKNVLIGIVSWGFGCGKQNSPGIYMNVKNYVPWIISVIFS